MKFQAMPQSKVKYAVSVIIPTFNHGRFLDYTLKSLLLQDINKPDFEVIVADDGSSDDTREVVRKYESQMNLKYIFQKDLGYRPGTARNQGILAAEGKICLFIDSSVILNTHCIQAHIDFYAQAAPHAAAIGYVYGFDHNQESEELLKELFLPDDPFESVKRLSRYEMFRDVREQHYATHGFNLSELPAPWVFFWTCHVSALRQDLLDIGLFDEGYNGRWGMEDFDLGFRLHQHGVKICLLKSAESIHYPHEKDMVDRKKQGYQNCLYFHNKFRTFETELYLTHYHGIELVDINAISLQLTKTA